MQADLGQGADLCFGELLNEARREKSLCGPYPRSTASIRFTLRFAMMFRAVWTLWKRFLQALPPANDSEIALLFPIVWTGPQDSPRHYSDTNRRILLRIVSAYLCRQPGGGGPKFFCGRLSSIFRIARDCSNHLRRA